MTTDITELAQRMKAAAVRAKTATEEYASGHMSVSVCYAECEEFNRLTDGPDNSLALVEALEKARQRITQLESRSVKLPKRSVGEVMHMSGFSRDYAEGWCSGNDNAIHEMRAAGIKVEAE